MLSQTLDPPLAADVNPQDIFDLGRPFLRNFAALTLSDLHQYITPIPTAAVAARHSDPHSPGPDFLLSVHIPRHAFQPRSQEIVDPFMNTLPHLYRTHDFIRMSASSWEDINILIANVFAGFSGYSVQWYAPSSFEYVDYNCLELIILYSGVPQYATHSMCPKAPRNGAASILLLQYVPSQQRTGSRSIAQVRCHLLYQAPPF